MVLSDDEMLRFLSKIGKPTDRGCTEWMAARNSKGYGQFGVGGRMYVASRLMYSIAQGAIPKGMLVCHTCDNPPCINPDHLFLGTPKDNQSDKSTKGRCAPQKGSQNNHARLTESAVREIRTLRNFGMPVAELASLFNVHQTTVSKIITRATWLHV